MTRAAWLDGKPEDWFPPVDQALADPRGLLAIGGTLSPERLAAAYSRGIFPWYGPEEPVLWWAPDPREVLFPAEFHRSRSLAKRLRSGAFRVTEDTAFARVITACADARKATAGTWITDSMREAYINLHRLGRAHSVETWQGDELVGGLYGVRSGRVFSGESMFSLRDDASKAALSWLVDRCPERGIEVIDCQMPSGHLRSLGSRAISREEFLVWLTPDAPRPATAP